MDIPSVNTDQQVYITFCLPDVMGLLPLTVPPDVMGLHPLTVPLAWPSRACVSPSTAHSTALPSPLLPRSRARARPGACVSP